MLACPAITTLLITVYLFYSSTDKPVLAKDTGGSAYGLTTQDRYKDQQLLH